jgi:hypothetical protein
MTGSGYFQIPGHAGQDDIWFDTFIYSPERGALFPLHEACIETSCRAIDHHQSKKRDGERKSALALLSQLLNARFVQKNAKLAEILDIDKDIFDLCVCSPVYGPRSVQAMTELEWWGGEYDVRRSLHM